MTKATMRIPLRIVFYQEDGEWVAHCLEFDLVGVSANKPEAIQLLGEAISAQLAASISFNNPDSLFAPAEGKFFHMFARGKDIAQGQLEIAFDELPEGYELNHVEVREYDDSDLVCA